MKIKTIKGILRKHPRGFGFVQVEGVSEISEVFIPKNGILNAIDGDLVEVTLAKKALWLKGPEGTISKIITRRTQNIVAIITHKTNKDYFGYSSALGISKPIKIQIKKGDHLGDRILVKVTDWGNSGPNVIAKSIKNLGNINDPSGDFLSCVYEFGLPLDFPKTVIDESKKYGNSVEFKGREDFSKLETFTIDPRGARDLDDALSLYKDEKGHFHLYVHIADVSHYVKNGSEIDKEAYLRCNSTYLPEKCIPMLPEILSSNLCSLQPKKIRLTISVIMEFDAKGILKKSSIAKSFIKSAKQFTYEEAFDVIQGKSKSKFSKSLKTMVELCHLLKNIRHQRGSIDLSVDDIRINVDKKGVPTSIEKVEYDVSHQLVEEFMLKANEVVAMTLYSRNISLLYRVHEKPTIEDLYDFFNLARSFGFVVENSLDNDKIQKLFEEAKPTPYYHFLCVQFIRSMKAAYYNENRLGHYALQLENYTHFTSPIRRYCDLLIHRLLFEDLPDINLHEIGKRCSERARNSFLAENNLKKLKILRFLQKRFKENKDKVYKATITKTKHHGIMFEIPELLADGFLHVSRLGHDFFEYDEEGMLFYGVHTGKEFKPGDTISVKISEIDLILLESRWEIPHVKKK